MKSFDSFDVQQVRTDTGNAGSHRAQHPAKVADMRFACRIKDRRFAFTEDGCHYGIFCRRDTGFVQKHIGTGQVVGANIKFRINTDLCPEGFESQKMSIETAATDNISAGRR